MSMMKEFKEFAMRGNVMDMAVGIIIGAAFGGDTPAVVLKYGVFINTMIDFIIVALAIFLVIKGMNKLKRKEEAAPPEPPKPSKQEILLTEIRDVLKSR